MRRLGGIRELAGGPTDPSLADVARASDEVQQRRTAAYLLTATRVRMTMEQIPDILDGEAVYLSGGLCSDGDWYWREDLAHYVMKYNVVLPKDFYRHAEANLWSPGVLAGDGLIRAVAAVRKAETERGK